MKNEFKCSQCGLDKVHESDISTGYGYNSKNEKICFECCGKNDEKELNELQPKQKAIQYWNGKEITNWPGTLKIKPYYTSKGRHNIARTREDIYFSLNGKKFHAVQYGSNSQIAHIKTTK